MDIIEKEMESDEKLRDYCQSELDQLQQQLQELDEQAHHLTSAMDSIGVQIVEARSGDDATNGVQARQLQNQLEDVKEFNEANQGARLSLVDQRARVEKQKGEHDARIADCWRNNL